MLGQNEEILADQRFPAGKQNDRRLELCQFIDKFQRFLCGQFIVILFAFRTGIAVAALEIARPRIIPSHHRPAAFTDPVFLILGFFRVTQLVPVIGIAGQHLR